MNKFELEEAFRLYDWDKFMYDPLHDAVEAVTDAEREELAGMEALLEAWSTFYEKNEEAALELAANYWSGKPMAYYIEEFITQKIKHMNEKNLDYLKDNLKYHGFGESLHTQLETQMKTGAPEFSLVLQTKVNKDALDATLHFKRSDNSEHYFFNKYDARSTNEKTQETVAQTFYLNKGHGVTLKEAYNLLNGRAVQKELTDKQDQKYQAWIQLDFSKKDQHGNFERKQFHQNYGFDLKEALSRYPVKELQNSDDAAKLMRSLERGNLHQVTIEKDGKEVKVFMDANPQYKSINLYDENTQRLGKEQRDELKLEKKPTKEVDREELPEKKQQKDQSKENGLIEKKRESSGKGLSV